MTSRLSFLFLALLGANLSFCQISTEWQGSVNGIIPRNGALILQDDLYFDVYQCGNHNRLSHVGDWVDQFTGIGVFHSILLANETDDGIFYLRKRITGSTDEIEVVFRTHDGNIIEMEPLMDPELGNTNIKPPSCIQVSDNEFAAFGRDFFYRFNVDFQTYTREIIWGKANEDGVGVDADMAGNGFIVAVMDDVQEVSTLKRLDADGDIVWEKSMPGDMLLTVKTLDESPESFVIGGQRAEGAFLQKLNANGDLVWEEVFDQDSTVYEVIETEDGGLAFTGANNDEEMIVVKTDGNGQVQWRVSFADVEGGNAIVERPYGGYFVSGYRGTTLGFVAAIGANGELGPDVNLNNNVLLDVNNISTPAHFPNDYFLNGEYFFPNGAVTTTLFHAGLWLGGVDATEQLQVAGEIYSTGDFEPGLPGSSPEFFNRTWALTREMVDRLKADLSDGALDEKHSYQFFNWPAKGNPHIEYLGEPIEIDRDLAPFVDANGDGIYNPYEGDYPEIKGEKMLWWVFHDDTDHEETGGEPLNVLVACSFYAFGCSDDTPIFNSTFLDYEITSLNDAPIDEFRVGLFYDNDLGCYSDDFIGSIPDLDACIVYNADVIDGSPICGITTPTFEDDIPIQSQMLLSHPMSSLMYLNNASVSNPPNATTAPSSDTEYYNYMTAKWRDGTPLTSGGEGYDVMSSDIASFAFDGDPSNLEAWSACSIELPNYDRRLVSSADLGTLLPGESVVVRSAWVTTPSSVLPCPALDEVRGDLEAVKNFDAQGWFGLTSEVWVNDTIVLTASPFLVLPEGGTYQWSNGETGNTVEIESDGWVEVEITSPWGCSQTDRVYVVLMVDADSEVLKQETVRVYPNPIGSNRTLLLETDNFQVEQIRLFEVSGKMVLSQKLNGENKLQLKGLKAGMYFLEIESEGRSVWKKVSLVN